MVRGVFNWTHQDVVRVLKRFGFVLNYTLGSHQFYFARVDGQVRQVCVPFHGKSVIKPKTIKSIIEQSGIPASDWQLK